MMKAFGSAICLVVAGTWGSSALACSPPPAKNAVQIRALAQDSFARADAIADVTVNMAASADPDLVGAMPLAVLETSRVWKGKVPELFGVVYLTTCDVLLDRPGVRYRVLLTRVNDSLFTVDSMLNGPSVNDRRIFDQEIDRLIGNPRKGDFAAVGEVADKSMARPPDLASKTASRNAFGETRVLLAGLAVAVLSSLATWLTLRFKVFEK